MRPTAIEIGGLALIVGILAFAQRLGRWENRRVARSLGVIAACLSVAWVFLFLPVWAAWTISIAISGASILLAVKWIKESRSKTTPKRRQVVQVLHKIDFHYLPISPIEKGWTKAYLPDGAADFSTDPSIPESLRIQVTNSVFAMDHTVPHHATLSEHLGFTAKYTDGTMIFTELHVASKDGSQRRRVWLKYYHGEERSEQTMPTVQSDAAKELPEQTVWLPAQILEGGRMAFDIDFPDVVKFALGDQGWVYKSARKVRLRGSLSISPLTFGRFTPPS